jgi:hypothetical protein
MDEQKIARRLSGALGRKVAAEDIDVVHGENVVLKDGTYAGLLKGNVAYTGGRWWRNGQQLTEDEVARL